MEVFNIFRIDFSLLDTSVELKPARFSLTAVVDPTLNDVHFAS